MRHLLRYKLICGSQADALAVQARINTEVAGHPAAANVFGPIAMAWHLGQWLVHGTMRWATVANANNFSEQSPHGADEWKCQA